ncbi:endoplasmic oxidoreductin [Teratosphaeria nubilosa]|uniref:Endoplasmic oxidoreductin n=1 Tax=Teratosphaeria nubilosa TaxID=161662 RepID=A0A6G1LGS8_9PEZI|nr:endoplasmic oxidoreductin [Teratosphaeria nubilosa]
MRRRTPAQAFYLAFFALFSAACKAASPTHSSPDACALQPKAQVSDACASYADLDRLNHQLQPYVKSLANNTDFFSYYRLNLYNKDCPFWHDDDGLCGNIACAVTTLENEEDIPQIWRAEELSKLEGPKAEHPGRKQQRERQRPLMNQLGQDVGESCVVEYDDECDDRDYCVPEDESASAKGDYVSLAENPERFTGYAGEASHRIWEAIYRENCFSKPSGSSHSAAVPGLSAPRPGFSPNQARAALDFKQIVKAHDRQEAIRSGVPVDELEFEDECLEKRVFYRVISGMHASISTHLCYEYLNQTTGEWSPNLQCYKERLHEHPEWVSNLYFNYALMLRAVGKLRDYVQDYTFCTGDPVQDKKTKDMIRKLSSAIPDGPQIFDESVMFQDGSMTENGISLKEDFRNRFRNVSRIMDCVGCDKCRLWGKLQTNGFGTALKVLFEFGNGHAGEEKPLLRRTDLVALINTLDKISTSLKAIEHFQSCQPPPEETLTEIFWTEYNNMYRAISFVLKQWYNTPRTLATIAYGEFMRLTEYWLGLRVRERNWEFRFPRVDEL